MAAIIQRVVNNEDSGEDSLGISEAEKQALLDTLEKMNKKDK